MVQPFLTKVESPKTGVGKSTLINALEAGKEILLPAGGIGPLTAHALTVRYGETRRFRLRYHPLQNLWKVVFVLKEVHKKESAAATAELQRPTDTEISARIRYGVMPVFAAIVNAQV